jgi:hypothetical protein
MFVYPCMRTAYQLRLAAGDVWQSSLSYLCKPCEAEQLHVHHCYVPRTLSLQLAYESSEALVENDVVLYFSRHGNIPKGYSSVVVVYQSHLKQSATLSTKATAVEP